MSKEDLLANIILFLFIYLHSSYVSSYHLSGGMCKLKWNPSMLILPEKIECSFNKLLFMYVGIYVRVTKLALPSKMIYKCIL